MTKQLPKPDAITTIGQRLRLIRKAASLTQEQVGETCEVTKGMVSQWESDQVIPATDRLLMLRKRIDFSIDWLLTGEPKEPEDPREDALLQLFRASDGRGKDTIFRVAEQESIYEVKPGSTKGKAA